MTQLRFVAMMILMAVSVPVLLSACKGTDTNDTTADTDSDAM